MARGEQVGAEVFGGPPQDGVGVVGGLKGGVVAKRDLVIPPRGPFDDLTVANIAARQRCAEVNTVPHSQIAAVPAERLEAERDLLSALP